MSAEELALKLNLDRKGIYGEDGTYVIDIRNSDEFGRYYSRLDNNEELECVEESTLLTTHNGSLLYRYGDEFQITLIADFDNDEYRAVIMEV